MARKYTILKVLIQNLNKGFTLIELIVGLLIMTIVGGLAMNALVDAGNTFNNDKKNIDSSQNLSAILEIIGNDIKQSGEQINDGKFPVIKIENIATATTALKAGSSRITIRRALMSPFNLCLSPTASVAITSLVVADNTKKTTNPNCKSDPLPTTTLPSPIRPTTLREARNYRCKLDDPNADYSSTTTDFCRTSKASPDREKVRAAMSDLSGNIWTFDYVDDSDNVGTTADPKFNMTIGSSTPPIAYQLDTPIYLIEERIYTLDPNGNLNLQRDGEATPVTLISGIEKFNVSARVYSDLTTKAINATPSNACTTVQDPDTPSSTYASATNPQYACSFNPSDATYNWKTLAGVKVKLQSRYDPTGRNATPTTADTEKLSARAEFFPRNVLSK
jgi:prepilin-type N-terminal cleavage/methylation domain-containing protein